MQEGSRPAVLHPLVLGQSSKAKKKSNILSNTRSVPKKKIRKPLGFMDLPGEIRNQIYGYYFQQSFQCDFADKEARLDPKKSKVIKLHVHNGSPREVDNLHEVDSAPVSTVRCPRVLGFYKRIEGLDTRWKTSLTGLHLACKQVHAEIIASVYKNTTFGFDSPKQLLSFLKVPSAYNLAHVTKIQLHYRVYGDPTKSEDLRWKQKSLDCWSRTCKTTAKQLINLQHVDIRVYTRETSVRFDVQEPYLKPVFWFRKRRDTTKTIAKALATVNVHIDTFWSRPEAFSDEQLQSASTHLHRLFGGAVGRVILGETVDEAMKDFNDAWDNKYPHYHHFLQFARTGW